MNYDWKEISASKELNRESQKEHFPYFMNPGEVFGLKIQVNRHVFSPKHCKGFRFFIPRLPDVTGKRVLEIGSGHGVVACYLAKTANYVLAIDINRFAVKNTQINARHNKLTNLETRVSDIYSNIRENERFDVIFWNSPWAVVPREFEQRMEPEDFGMFDVGYRALSRFMLEGKTHLNKKGSLYLGFGEAGADLRHLDGLIERAGLKKKIIADEPFKPGEKMDGKPIEYRLILYKFSI